MLVISLVTLFIGSSFLPLFSNYRTSVIPICPGSSIWDTKSYCTFVPTVTPYQVWRKAFLVEECKSLSPRDLLKEALSFGVCLLAEEPKSLVATPLPVCPVSSCPLHVFPLPSCPLVSLPSPSLLPPAPLPPVCNTGFAAIAIAFESIATTCTISFLVT
ncbi:hypothetical protein EDC94DRAFT_587505 [Helicostylum pulchrum]|nr:hypothetical protein EDC94DRAFT_587505 [Helicostylum pulchrum]